MKNTVKVVELQIDRGERKFDENGTYIGERQNVTFSYGDTSWAGNIRNLRHMGITNVEVVKAYGHTTKHKDEQNPDDVYRNDEIEVTDELKTEVATLFSNKKEIPKSAEQQQIDELKAQIAALTNPKKEPVSASSSTDVNELDQLHADYKAKFDKAVPNNKKNDVEWLKLEIAK